MPGFILNVQGLEVLFKVLDGVINTANRILSVFLENASPALTGETRSPGQVMSAIGIGDAGFPSLIVRSVLPFFRAPEGDTLNSGVAEKGGVVTFEFTCYVSVLVVSQKF